MAVQLSKILVFQINFLQYSTDKKLCIEKENPLKLEDSTKPSHLHLQRLEKWDLNQSHHYTGS